MSATSTAMVAVAVRPARERRGADEFDPIRAAEAAKALVESIRAMAGDEDDELLADMVEGETSLFDIVDALIQRRNSNAAFVDALKAHVDDLKLRQGRYEKRIETDRALIEQAMSIAGLVKIERPYATLSLSQRAAKLVVDEEAAIPPAYWKAGDPKLDRDGLKAAVLAREAERQVRLGAWRALHGADAPPPNDLPAPIPGAHMEPPAATLTVRIK